MTDEITLVLPRERDFEAVAHLVLGGLAARLDLTYEHLEDLQLGIDGLLERRGGGDHVVVRLVVLDDAIEAIVGPFDAGELNAELERDSDGIGLRRLLDTVVDGVRVTEEAEGDFVRLTKHVGLAKAGS